MPLFYFDVYASGSISRDEEGHALPSREAARREALRLLPDLARDEVRHHDGCEAGVHVRDENGAVILAARLSLQARWVEPGNSAEIAPKKRETA